MRHFFQMRAQNKLSFWLLGFLLPFSSMAAETCLNEKGVAVPIPVEQQLLLAVRRCANASRMQIHAHRGAGNRPQNTMAAFREAARQGADTIELDLQITKDGLDGKGTVIVAHDHWVPESQCLTGAGNKIQERISFRDLSLEEIQKFDCGSLVGKGQKSSPGEKIPTLQEVLVFLEENKQLRLNIEIKYDPNRPEKYPPLEQYVKRIVDTTKESGVPKERFFFQSFHHEALRLLKEKEPEWEISPLLGSAEKILTAPVELGAKMVTPHFKGLDGPMLDKLQSSGIKVVPWTANSDSEMRALIDLGVDGIITDEVGRFQKIKNEYCGH